MNFEKIELYGFKSFADKQEIKFGSGITGIVGPNGCGKSNVADAIKWVLGEQSAKSLRGSSMQDVIFSGTQGRKSLSYCEVSLFFDNTNRMFSIDYNEVIITRKLFRSGESEYYINKQPARLKDIVNLLHECGIGKEGYSIIGQGKVEEIMSAKPEDRRMIFEEATGISKFKASKNESERKLERTHDNLVRFNDILSEIENQLGPLEKQAEKAKEYNELTELLKHHELNTYIAQVEGVAGAKDKIYLRIKGIDEQTALRQQELEMADKEYEKIFNSIQKADSEIKNLNEELVEKSVNIEKSSGATKLFEERISFTLGEIDRSNLDIKNNNVIIDNGNEFIKEKKIEIENLQKEYSKKQIEYETLNKRLSLLNEKVSTLEEINALNQKKVIESLETLTDVKVNAGTMSIEKTNLDEKYGELSNKITKLDSKKQVLYSERDNLKIEIEKLEEKLISLNNEIKEDEEKVRLSNEDVASFENKLYTLNSQLSSLTAKDNFYKSLKDSYEGYTSSVRTLMSKAKVDNKIGSKILGVVAEIITNEQKYDIALEVALGASAQNIVTANPDDAKELIEYLKVNKFGRVTFLPITSVRKRDENYEVTSALKEKGALGVADKLVNYDKKFENIISNLLGNTLIVDTLDNATNIAKKYHFAFRIVTLDGDEFSTRGAMTGGSKRQDTVGLLSSDRKIEENAKLLKEKQEELDSVKKDKVSAEEKRDNFFDELNKANELVISTKQQIVILKEKLSLSNTAIGEVELDKENSVNILSDLSEKLTSLDEKFRLAEVGGKKLEEDKESIKSIAEKQAKEFEELKKERDDLNGKVGTLLLDITEGKNKISLLHEQVERTYQTVENAKNSIQKLNDTIVISQQKVKELRIEEEKVALSKEEQEYVNGLRNKISTFEEEKVTLKEKLDKNEEKKKYSQAEIDSLTEKKNNEKIALAKVDSDLEYMGQSIWEDYQETYESAVKVKEEGYDAKFGAQEIVRLRKKRSALGSINAEAIDDAKILRERRDEMVAQKEDLEKAESDLKVAIDKIKGEMLTQFDEGFNKINENFQKIFKELFGGGRAMLELDYTEVDDKLEAGIEIIAEPPGKKLQKLSLLSGGEKALTAIAILFAILKMRPMPFCVLDEIEAALDEANVDRFARYLQKFSKETQFIVITHRKPTMELADSLFGVTMEEKGVSKTVSVKLSDAADYDVV